MSDENQKKPDPIEDVRKGLGLLFRAAKTAVSDLPTDKVEAAVVSGVKEVGKALENVAQAIDKEVFKGSAAKTNDRMRVEPDAPKTEAQKTEAPKTEKSDEPKTEKEEKKPVDGAPKS
ncbi:MAG: hypothetical protein ACRELY_31400 [Polyangiaceae bacterium]